MGGSVPDRFLPAPRDGHQRPHLRERIDGPHLFASRRIGRHRLVPPIPAGLRRGSLPAQAALAGLAQVEPARAELALAIPLLKDPTDALVDRASLSFHVNDRETAVKEITAAIERRPLVPEYYDTRSLYRRFLHDFRGAARTRSGRPCCASPKGLSAEELEERVKALLDYTPISEPQDSPAVAAERARFMGKWDVLARESGGESLDMTDRDFSITFGADRYRLVIDGRTRQGGTFTLDPKRQPYRIDWTARIDGKEHRVLGLYEFRGETLKLCMANAGEPRPAKLATTGLGYVVLYTLRRSARSGTAAEPGVSPGS